MVNYGGVPGVVNQANTARPTPQPNTTPNQSAQTQPNYSQWINPTPSATQMATEQRGITSVFMVNSRAEYGYYSAPSGQSIALFNFPEGELCLKARDMWGVDLPIRTWSLTETTTTLTQPIPVPQPAQSQQASTPSSSEPLVSKEEFDKLSEKINALYNELKGES